MKSTADSGGFLGECLHGSAGIEVQKIRNTYVKEKRLPVFYDDQKMKKYFVADFVCYKSIIIELKATKFTIDADIKQTLNNSKSTQFKLGSLINFGTPSSMYKRIVN